MLGIYYPHFLRGEKLRFRDAKDFLFKTHLLKIYHLSETVLGPGDKWQIHKLNPYKP